MTSPTIAELGERELLARLQRWLHPTDSRLSVPAGDDCAVLVAARDKMLQVLTTDLMVEGTHFLRDPDLDFYALGQRAVVSNISDLAAMGANPVALLISIGLPGLCLSSDIERLYEGMAAAAKVYGARLVGGDTARSANLVLNIVATGEKSNRDSPCLRSMAKPGQNVFITGKLGGARAGLELQLHPERQRGLDTDTVRTLVSRQQVPTARVKVGRVLACHFPDAAAIDISDGLHNELNLLAEASNCGFRIPLADLPVYPGVEAYCRTRNENAVAFAACSGEEYELLFCTSATVDQVKSAATAADVSFPITLIGSVQPGKSVVYVDADGNKIQMPNSTFQHFTSARRANNPEP